MTKDQAIAIVRKIDNYESELRSIESGLLGIRMQLVQEFRIHRNDAGLLPEPGVANPEPGGESGDLVALANEMLQQLKTCRVNESVTAAFQQRLLAWAPAPVVDRKSAYIDRIRQETATVAARISAAEVGAPAPVVSAMPTIELNDEVTIEDASGQRLSQRVIIEQDRDYGIGGCPVCRAYGGDPLEHSGDCWLGNAIASATTGGDAPTPENQK